MLPRSIYFYLFLVGLSPWMAAQTNQPWQAFVDGAVAGHPAVQAAERAFRAETLKVAPQAVPADPMVMAEFMKLPLAGASARMRETQYSVTENFPFPARLAMAAARQSRAAEAARWTLELRKRLVHREAVRTLLGLAYYDRALEIGRERLAQYGLVESVVTARYGVGKATQSEWGRTKLMVAMARAELAMQEGERAELAATLRRLSPSNESTAAPALRFTARPLATIPALEELVAKAEASFPELRMQQAMESRMKAEKNLMGWEWAPDLSLRGTITQTEAGDMSATAGIGVSLPIWFAFRQAPNAAAASSMLEAEKARSRDTRAMVLEAVRMKHVAFTAANRALEILEQTASPQAAQVVEVALKEYQVDRIGFTELLEALKSVSDTSLEVARTRRVFGEQAEELRYYTGVRPLAELP